MSPPPALRRHRQWLKSVWPSRLCGWAIGSTGYTALTEPGSVISQLILAAITLFIACRVSA
jgi:hypothetical protein